MLFFIGLGITGAVMPRAAAAMHNGAWSFLVGVLVLSLLSWQGEMNLLTAVVSFVLIAATQWLLPQVGVQANERYEKLPRLQQRSTRWLVGAALLVVLLFLPPFAGLSLTNTLNLTALYITMGIGLSVMIGYAGLLDLGYVATYAVGAYTIGLLTTPSLLTCGGMTPDQISAAGLTIPQACTGVMTFWQGMPLAVLASACTGILLGVPVLRLRGDYLAIVTLGFGEIIQVLIKSTTFKPLLGGAQGIISIPLPELNLSFLNQSWDFRLAKSTEVYYLYIFGVMVAAFIVTRLIHTRLGRAWRAMREDEDVAEAMGINLVGTKLLAFAISSAFAGLGGAIFGTTFQSIFPNSFTLVVSINVLSLIIIGGMGSIPGVILGSLILIGLPEVLRELQDYRLLAFGALLVAVMILKPEGLLPPQPAKLSEEATDAESVLKRQPQGAD
jgi:branched-chain amino acid transport system permease protein